MSQKAFLFVLEVDPLETGESYQRLPLHCTLMHWFYAGASHRVLHLIGQEALGCFDPVRLTATEKAFFGKQEDVSVSRIKETVSLMEMHRSLYRALQNVSISYTAPQWVGDGYKPHVTFRGKVGLDPGTRVTASSVALIEALDGDYPSGARMVRGRIPLT